MVGSVEVRKSIIRQHYHSYCLSLLLCIPLVLIFLVDASSSTNGANGNAVYFGTKTTGFGSRKKTIVSSLSSQYQSSSLLKALIPSNNAKLYYVNPLKRISKTCNSSQLWATLIYNKQQQQNVTTTSQMQKQRPVAIRLFQRQNIGDTANNSTIEWGCVSISTQMNHQLSVKQVTNWTPPPALLSASITTGETKAKDLLLLPIEGIYGVFHLFSGPCLVVILESEAVYNSPSASPATTTPPFLELRRVTRMDIIPIPFEEDENHSFHDVSTQHQQQQQHHRKEELRQIKLLRKALRSHELYYIPPRNNQEANYSRYRVCDVTHTLQRALVAATNNITATATNGDKNHEDNINMLQPDARFFWNQELVQSLLLSSTVQQQQEAFNESAESVNEAFVSIDTSLVHTTNNSNMNNTTAPKELNSIEKPSTNENNVSTKSSSSSSSLYSAHRLLRKWIIPCTSAFVGISRNVSLLLPTTTTKENTNSSGTISSSNNTNSSNNDTTTTKTKTYYDELLISRRSRFRAGTRFTRRGVDMTGSVANYAETEQILLFMEQQENNSYILKEVYSFVQTRGSIPILWSSPAKVREYAPRVQIATNPLDQARSLRAHVLEQLLLYTSLLSPSGNSYYNRQQHLQRSPNTNANKIYVFQEIKIPPKLIFVNLIDKKKDQGRLGKAFDSVLKAVLEIHGDDNDDHTPMMISFGARSSTDEQHQHPTMTDSGVSASTNMTTLYIPRGSVSHLWYDFHAECKGGKWNKLNSLMEKVSADLDSHRYFSASPIIINGSSLFSWNIATVQTGVVRTNCMDCLDRTNVVQSIFGRHVLFRQLQHRDASAKITKVRGTRNVPLEWVVAHKNNPLQLPFMEGELAHRTLWADNADAISRLYAGTPALKGDYTRTGRRTKRGALDDGMNSLTRYYINNFSDADRQEGIDLMTSSIPFSNTDVSTTTTIDVSSKGILAKSIENDYTIASSSSKIPGDGLNLRRLLFGDYIKDIVIDAPSLHEDICSSIDRRASSRLPWWIATNMDEKGVTASRNKKKSVHHRSKTVNEKLQSNNPVPMTLLLGILDYHYPELVTSMTLIMCIVFLLI